MLDNGPGQAALAARAVVPPARPAAPGRHGWALPAAILLLGALLRTACVAVMPSPLVSDYLDYWTLATNLQAGLGLVTAEGRPTAFMSPGYPLFLAGVFGLTGASIAVVKATNVLLGVASILLLFLLARRLFGSPLVAALAALLLAAYAEAIAYTAYAAKENLMMPLMIGLLWVAADRSASRARWINPLAFGVIAGAIAMVGNAALTLVPAALFLVWRAQRSPGRTLRYLLVAAMAGAVTIAPLMLRNHAAFGAWVLNNNGGFNLYIGNNPAAKPYFISIAETPVAPQWSALQEQLGEHGVDVLLRRLAIEHMRDHPGETAMLMLRKAAAFWEPPTHTGIDEQGWLVRLVRLAWLAQFLAAAGLCLGSLALLRRHPRGLGAVFLALAGYTAVHMIFYVVYRYRLPIMPFVFLGAGVTLAALLPPRLAARVLPRTGEAGTG
ncbi:hypothetical protein EAH89_18445 [Roseomonas nepalensis]|uniref:Glycosyltransferase RgtA/B/C/D-like domain-containing protein n=1 Tax=Muricoccus nepalensis TaxID=1854500 RepID=A0A502FTC2_9PROT|nr:glycosyltransferase family 39 protein [Roseomonas nepalensis]TPG52366.1 hypothetical protein EAH89_18445 [Roseomonas nepalensis]